MALDAITPTWINAPDAVSPPVYDAETLRRNDSALLAPGATAGTSRTGVLDPRALVVTLSGSNVQVGPGPAAIGTGKGAYLTGASAVGTFGTLTPADGTSPRRDRTMLVILDPDNAATGTARKAEFRYIPGTPSPTALTGGGYPPVPAGISGYIDLYDIDVPKSGTGSPSVTDRRQFTVAAGAPIPVQTLAERDALPKWNGMSARRLDLKGAVEYCDGTSWTSGIAAAGRIAEIIQSANSVGFSSGEWLVDTIPSVKLLANRKYRFTYRFEMVMPSQAGQAVVMNFKKSLPADTGVTGTVMDAATVWTAPVANSGCTYFIEGFYTPTADETVRITTTTGRLTGTSLFNLAARRLTVVDEGQQF